MSSPNALRLFAIMDPHLRGFEKSITAGNRDYVYGCLFPMEADEDNRFHPSYAFRQLIFASVGPLLADFST